MKFSDFVEVEIDNVSLSNLGFIVFLKQSVDSRVLPINIGPAEAHSIAVAYNGQTYPRPLSHDLMKSILGHLGCQLDRVCITELAEGTFHARLYLRQGKETFDLDSRSSDAIALALRYSVPILVHKRVFEDAAIEMSTSPDRTESRVVTRKLSPIEQLELDLQKAVQEENYEDAAAIRDQLQKLKAEN